MTSTRLIIQIRGGVSPPQNLLPSSYRFNPVQLRSFKMGNKRNKRNRGTGDQREQGEKEEQGKGEQGNKGNKVKR